MFQNLIKSCASNICNLLNVNYTSIKVFVKKKKEWGEWFLWELNEMKHVKYFAWSVAHSKCSIVATVIWLVSWMAPSHLPLYFLHRNEIICNYFVYIFVYLPMVSLKTELPAATGSNLPRGPLWTNRCPSTTFALSNHILQITGQECLMGSGLSRSR